MYIHIPLIRCDYDQKMMTHHFVLTSSLRIKNDFSSDFNYNSKADVFRDVISLIINQCEPRRQKGASGEHKVPACRTAEASEARLPGLNFFLISLSISSTYISSISVIFCLKTIGDF